MPATPATVGHFGPLVLVPAPALPPLAGMVVVDADDPGIAPDAVAVPEPYLPFQTKTYPPVPRHSD